MLMYISPHPYPTLQVSAHAHRDEGFHDHAITFLFVAWAQFTDHDLTLTADVDEIVEEELNCCRGSIFLILCIYLLFIVLFLPLCCSC